MKAPRRLPKPLGMTSKETHNAAPFSRMAVIGCGLIGSSIARAARVAGAVKTVAVADRDPAVRAAALSLGIADEAREDPAEAVAGADLVILATPVLTVDAVMRAIAPALGDGAILSDVGSVKQAVIDQVLPHLPSDGRKIHFTPAHPVAGTEQSGPEAGFAELFAGRWCIVTPLDGADPAATARLAGFWEAIGARVETMTPERHDRVLGITSHLPHLIAYTIVGTASDLETIDEAEVIKYSAGGFRDFTRIASSDPTMWRDVFLTNREAVLELLGHFMEDLIALQRAIRFGDGERLFDHFSRTQAVRKSILTMGQDIDAPDFGRRLPGDAGLRAGGGGGSEEDERET